MVDRFYDILVRQKCLLNHAQGIDGTHIRQPSLMVKGHVGVSDSMRVISSWPGQVDSTDMWVGHFCCIKDSLGAHR